MNRTSRRGFIGAAGLAAASLATSSAIAAEQGRAVKILGISCSPRKSKTTSIGLQAALDAAKEVGGNVQTELIELGGLNIDVGPAYGIPIREGQQDDFLPIAEKLRDPAVAGIIIGSPTHFGNMSTVCSAFLNRCMALRKDNALKDKVGGVLAVGAARNGGQELVIQSIQAVLFCHDMVLVGDGAPNHHRGATLWNNAKDDIAQDKWGMDTARALGRHVAEVAIKMAT